MLRILIAGLATAFLLAGCEEGAGDSTKQGNEIRESLMQRAMNRVPVPQTNNFLTRQSVAKWLDRQDTPDRPHYVYVYSDMGSLIGYYVAQSRPVSTCTFMTPPEQVIYSNHQTGVATGTAPGLDGVYYGAGGSCDQWFFFDAETDAMIELTGFKIFTSDAPLRLDAEPIRVETAPVQEEPQPTN